MITRFSSPRQQVTAERVEAHSSRSLVPEIIVGRDLCRYLLLDLAHVPAAQRRQALLHQIESQSPWSECGHAVVWREGLAQVWLWDRQRLEQRLSEHHVGAPLTQLRQRNAARLPEAWFQPRPADDVLLQVACTHGHELQYWRQGVLRASRWYAHEPGSTDVLWVLRAQGLGPDTAFRVEDSVPLLQPWSGSRPTPLLWLRQHQRGSLIMLLLASLTLASLQVSAAVRWWSLEQDYRHQAAALQSSADSLLQSRGEARRSAQRYEQMRQLFTTPDSLGAQWLVTSRLPDELDYQVMIWERTADDVELVIGAQIEDTLGLVRALSGAGIDRVSVEPWRRDGHYSLKMRLLPDAVVSSTGVPHADPSE